MKPFELKTQICGEELRAHLDVYGHFCIGPTGDKAIDATCCVGAIKSNEDRVALGRFLIEVGSKLATPKAKKE